MPFISMIIYSAIIVVADVLLAGAYTLVTGGGSILVTLSNLLFIEGGVVLLLGAIVEFFHLAGREDRMVVATRVLYPIGGNESKNDVEANVEISHPGWLLIFLGALLIFYSFTFILLFAK